MTPPPPRSTLFPYTTLFRSLRRGGRIPATIICSPSAARALCARAVTSPSSPGARWSSAARPQLWTLRPKSRSEEHTSELQSHSDLVCRLLLEKKKEDKNNV